MSRLNPHEEPLLREARIPDEVRGYLRAVIDHSKLRGTTRHDVLHELVAHFEDGLEAGRSADELLREFGDGRLVGALIRRSRGESLWGPRRMTKLWRGMALSATELYRDLRISSRGLRRKPGYAVVAILTLAIGIGANTAVFSVIDGVLLHPLPYPNAHELVLPVLTNPAEDVWDGPVGYADYLRWRDQRDVFQKVGVWIDWNLNVTGDDRPERIKGAVVSHRYFEVFGVRPILGRFFAPEEHERGGGKVAILSAALWRRRYGGDPNVLGATVVLDEEPYEIVGVVPPEAQWPRKAEIWIPLTYGAQTPDWVLERDALGFATIARLQPGVGNSQATLVVDQIARRAASERPDTRAGTGARVIPIRSRVVGANTPRTLWLLLGSVGFVLLIACANVANLALERSLGKRKEISIRAAIGAGRHRSVRPLVFEGLLVAMAGGFLGVVVAFWGTGILTTIAPAALVEIHEPRVNVRILMFGLAVSLGTGLMFTLTPAYLAAKLDIRQALTDGSARAGFGPAGRRVRNTMSVLQLALSAVLVLGASLTAKSTMRLLATDPGFQEEDVLSMKIFVPHYAPGSPEDRKIGQKYRDFTERIKSLPGVVSAATVSGLPLSPDGLFDNVPVWADGGADQFDAANHHANWNIVGRDFFSTMGIPLQRGRTFNETEIPTGPGVAIINESFARELFPNQDPIGSRIRSHDRITESPLEVIGVVGDVSYTDLTDSGRNVVYVSQSQTYWRAMAMVVRFDGDPRGRASEVREAIWSVDPAAPITEVRTMTDLTAESLAAPRLVTALVNTFAALALTLAAIGVYGVISVSVRQRYHELGVRKALGAGGGDIGRLLLGQGTKLAILGIGIGLPVGLALSRLLSGLLFDVRATDPVVLFGVPLLLAACAILAAAIPARRAARIDPVEALRGE
jgi:putative ABC transport system permease protein